MKHANIFISIALTTSIILCTIFGVLIFYNGEKPNIESKYDNAYCEYFITSCKGDSPLDTNVYIVNKSIIFRQNISGYCYPQLTNPNNFKIEVFFNISSIMVLETFTTDKGVSRCVSPFGINGTISGIASGRFKLFFIFDNQYVMQTHILKEFEINI